MFAITVELLTGRYVATAYNDRERVEWPPHPARMYSALVAAWGEGNLLDANGVQEREALEWLECLDAPDVLADATESAGIRTVVPVFVPVNDVSQVSEVDHSKLEAAEAASLGASDEKARAKAQKVVDKLRTKAAADTAKAIAAPSKFGREVDLGLRVLPDHRPKQPRTFPSATPATPRVAFVWPDAVLPPALVPVWLGLLARVVRLGHSSSLVLAELASAESLATWSARVECFQPDEEHGEVVLRWVERGQIARLARAYDRHRETEPRVLPARLVQYTTRTFQAAPPRPRSVFSDEFVVFSRIAGPRLPITSIAGLARQFRRALMSFAGTPTPEIISGHVGDGAATDRPHLAVVPLPVVTGPHPDGAIVGIALVLPRDTSPEARRDVMRAIGKFEQAGRRASTEDVPIVELRLGAAGVLDLQRIAWDDAGWTLDRRSWCRASRRWATATPIALDRNPGDLHDPDPAKRAAAFDAARATVIDSIARVGLPPAREVDVVRSCVVPGTSKPRNYPRYPEAATRPQRVLVHARIEFDQRVVGPLLLGAGRYHGLGLCLPVDDLKETR